MASLLRLIFATPTVKRDRLNLRLWFAVFCFYLAAVVVLSLWAFQVYSRTHSHGHWLLWLLGLYVFYFSLACSFVPIPTSWFVLFLASPAGGIGLDPVLRVVIVAATGAFATAVSHVNEYHLICYLLRLGKMHRVKETRIYLWAERIFEQFPFLLQFTFNVVPVPADPVRWLAIMYGYPLGKFFLAHWLGRFVRYGLMALAAEILKLTIIQIAVIQIVLLAIPVARIIGRRIQASRQPPEPVEE